MKNENSKQRQSAPTGAQDSEINLNADRPLGGAACSASSLIGKRVGMMEAIFSSWADPDSDGVLTSEQRENPSLLPQTLDALRLSDLGNKPLREVSRDELPYILSYLRSRPEVHEPLLD